MTATNTHAWRNRLLIFSIALICIIPFSFAWYLAKNPQLIKYRQKTNFGHLVTPARPVDYDLFTLAPVTTVENLPEIKGHWVMLQIVADPVCGENCKLSLQKTEKVRLLLSKDIPRVRRLLVFPGNASPDAMQELAKLDQSLLIAGLSEALRLRLQDAVGGPLADGMVLLLDPQTNVMMWYEPGADPSGMLRDLQRLLRISQIG